MSANNPITDIQISTHTWCPSYGQPSPESITIFRVNGYLDRTGMVRGGKGNRCQTYFISAQRDSFWRMLRAMRKLAVQKWENYCEDKS